MREQLSALTEYNTLERLARIAKMLEELLAGLRLQGSKTEFFSAIGPYQKLHGSVAEVTDTVKKQDILFNSYCWRYFGRGDIWFRHRGRGYKR